jgi:Zn-dependent peptidase ImmA (M78 family)
MNIFELITHSKKTCPVNLEDLFCKLGIAYKSIVLPSDIFGCLKKIGEDQFEIVVNSNNSKTRQRFTAAHELGHYVLHRHLLGDGVNDNTAYRSVAGSDCYNEKITPRHETEANGFAAEILMPSDLVRFEHELHGADVARLASRFQVSNMAMEIRLRSLGYR